ncbi:MAG: LysR family transcriptional regulator [Myxococcales bacterium FL481]|nr:MAG: LysR family transcriptional regulator [Myxococcales bacterium FL481]
MNWDDLRYLLALSRHRTLSASAKALAVNHTTVARRLQVLEQASGARLFDKTPRGYVATAAGEDMLRVAGRMEDELMSLDRRVLGQDARLSGRLRVTTLDALAIRFAADFRGFTRRYPAVELELAVDNEARSLTRREADVAMRVILRRPPDHLVGRRLERLEYALYGSRELVDDIGIDADLDAYPWMAWDERLGARMTEAWMAKHVPRARIACRVDTTMVMLASVRAGTGLSFLPTALADGDATLLQLRAPEPEFGTEVWLLTHPDLRGTARVRAFTEYMGGRGR